MNISNIRYKELDALRGLAAMLVIFFHYTMEKPEANLGFNLGITGVDLFFIISGFVIFMTLNKVSSGREFVINRFTRLFPTYWTCVTITFFGQTILKMAYNVITIDQISFAQYLPNMTMLQYYFKIPDLDGPYWTMIIELLFYFLMLLVFKARLIKNFSIVAFLSMFVLLCYEIILPKSYPNLFQNIKYFFPLFNHLPLFLAGIFFYQIKNGNEKRKIISNYVFLLFGFVIQLLLLDNTDRWQPFISWNQYLGMLVFYFVLFLLFVNNKLNFIVNDITLFLGKISFALYLIHQFFSIDLIIPYLEKHCSFNLWQASLVALPIVILMATCITFFVEIPVGRWLNQQLKSRFIY
ncbi:MAG: acyltransferase [Bacteroidetes bacterium]|nr:acyltransferase [Bacteroidota bacterium]